MQKLPRAFYDRDTILVARELLGKLLVHKSHGVKQVGRIVEVEAYLGPHDLAAHSAKGRTKRTEIMFGPPGHAYVYQVYGIHWCINFVCRVASAVLIRAIEPKYGIDRMMARRGTDKLELLCSGPGRLCQALAITKSQDGASLTRAPFSLVARTKRPQLLSGTRIGLTKGREAERRYGLKHSLYLSKKFPDVDQN